MSEISQGIDQVPAMLKPDAPATVPVKQMDQVPAQKDITESKPQGMISKIRELLNFGMSPEANEAGKKPSERLSPFTTSVTPPLENKPQNT